MDEKYVSQNLKDTEEILSELFFEVSSQETTLADNKNLTVGSRAIQTLRETKVSFGNPINNLIRLTERLFGEVGIELTELHKRQMREQFDFYYMTLSLSLNPGGEAEFKRIECNLDFGPKGNGEPIIQTFFPKPEWKELISLGAGMNIGLNGDLDWGVGIDPVDLQSITGVPGNLQANIANKNNLDAFITIPNYRFTLGSTHVAATGEGSSECFWRIEKPGLKGIQTLQFGVVFKVPKGQESIELKALAIAEPNMSWLLDKLRDVYEYLSDNLKRLLALKDEERRGEERLPIGIYQEWNIRLPR